MAEFYGVDCVICRQAIYADEDHIGRGYKILFKEQENISSNMCKKCYESKKDSEHVKDKKIFMFQCNDKYCKFQCKLDYQMNRPFWMRIK